MVSNRPDDSKPDKEKQALSGAPYEEGPAQDPGTTSLLEQSIQPARQPVGTADGGDGQPNEQDSDPQAIRFKKRLLALVGGPAERFRTTLLANPNLQSQQLSKLVVEFDQFARSYFDFFLQGKPINSLSQDLNTALTRLQTEAETINRACQQRESPEFIEFLIQADELAMVYYKQFHGYKIDPAALPITYFDKLFGIRRSPYTPYPLLSIPLLVFNDPDQWAGGLAHELGHYIYWNSSALETFGTIRPRLERAVLQALNIPYDNYAAFEVGAKVADIWIGWLEETFADICGTLLVGPNFVASGQLLVEEIGASLASDDGEHPAPFIRPLIAIETLAWVTEQLEKSNKPEAAAQRAKLKEIIRLFNDRWAEKLRIGREQLHEDSGLKMAEVERQVGAVVRAILSDGQGHAGTATWVGTDGHTPASLGSLFDYTFWVDRLPDPETAAAALTQIDFSEQTYGKDHTSRSFQELLTFLKGKFSSEKEVRQALLLLELEEELGEICRSRTVVRVGIMG